jgi:uncharacterized protein (TIGR02391 family)
MVATRPHSSLRSSELPDAVRKLERRLADIDAMQFSNSQDENAANISSVVTKINATYDDIFGAGTVEASQAHVSSTYFYSFANPDWDEMGRQFEGGRVRVRKKVQTSIELFKERCDEIETPRGSKILAAYSNLDLHPEISRAASSLYRSGHYANAIEDSVKALNDLVRLRSGLGDDGQKLMTTTFSPNNPILKFNLLADQSDKDEQQGFMMLFAGAVAGLRNPRAHKLIKDDAERALEFIAFVSLLAKLLDGATK